MDKLYPDANFSCYGLGWHLFDYRGRKIIEHGGAIDGMIAMVALVPEAQLGLVILCNRDSTRITYPILYSVLDSYFGAPPRDRNIEFLKIKEGFDKLDKERKEKDVKDRVGGTKPSLEPARFAGSYRDEFYGTLKVEFADDKFTLRYGQLTCDLEHWHYDTYRVIPQARHVEPFFITFRIGRDAKPESAKIEGLFGQGTFAYQDEGPAAVALSEAELAKFAGVYALDSPPLEITVELVAGKLKATVPGQSAAELAPIGPTRFKVKDAPGSFLTFEMAEGQVQKLQLETKSANLTFVPKRK
jgi:hypothetical protein